MDEKGIHPGVFGTVVDYVYKETYFNTKSTKKNTKGTNILWGGVSSFYLLCAFCVLLCAFCVPLLLNQLTAVGFGLRLASHHIEGESGSDQRVVLFDEVVRVPEAAVASLRREHDRQMRQDS